MTLSGVYVSRCLFPPVRGFSRTLPGSLHVQRPLRLAAVAFVDAAVQIPSFSPPYHSPLLSALFLFPSPAVLLVSLHTTLTDKSIRTFQARIRGGDGGLNVVLIARTAAFPRKSAKTRQERIQSWLPRPYC